MATTEQQLQAAIYTSPDKPSPMLAYADWLEGDAKADLVRAIVAKDVDKALDNAGITRQLPICPGTTPGLDSIRATITSVISTIAWNQFAADCAERVLECFETEFPQDTRPRQAILAARGEGQLSPNFALDQCNEIETTKPRSSPDCALAAAQLAAEAALNKGRPRLSAAGAAVFAMAAAHPDQLDTVHGEGNWQLLRLCQYKMFGKALTPVQPSPYV